MTKERQLPALKILGGVILAIVLLAFPLVFKKPFPQRMMILIFMYALLGEAWNILGGYAGQVSLGHAVFFGLGAYTSSFMLIRWGITPWLGMVAGILVAVAVSIIIGYPCFRLAGHYFAIATNAGGGNRSGEDTSETQIPCYTVNRPLLEKKKKKKYKKQ